MADAKDVAEIRAALFSALSAAVAAVTGMAELLRHDPALEGLSSWVSAYEANPDGEILLLGVDVIEPPIDALALAIKAGGLVRPLHRLAMDLERFQLGDDD